jgi:DNA-binding transcriptional regulator YiaG
MNIGSLLKTEISRVARKEVRGQVQQLRKHGSQYRLQIAALKRRVASLEKQLKNARRGGAAQPDSAGAPDAKSIRFSATGLAKQRQRLGLSAREIALLLNVSSLSVYKWETGKTRPRPKQLPSIAELRSLGRREARERLEILEASA